MSSDSQDSLTAGDQFVTFRVRGHYLAPENSASQIATFEFIDGIVRRARGQCHVGK